MNERKVKCGACGEVSLKEKWKTPEIEDGKFVGGCPHCSGEFYDEIKSNDATQFD